MGIYCTPTDLRDYGVLEGGSDDDLETIIARAEMDLDQRAFTTWPRDPDPTKRKFDPAGLDDVERDEVKRACCAQAEYRIEMGQEHFVRAQRYRVSRRGSSTEGKLPIIGPQVWAELRNSTLLRQTTRTGGRRGSRSPGWPAEDDEC